MIVVWSRILDIHSLFSSCVVPRECLGECDPPTTRPASRDRVDEIGLIGASDDVASELRIELHADGEQLEDADIFRRLRISPDELPIRAARAGRAALGGRSASARDQSHRGRLHAWS